MFGETMKTSVLRTLSVTQRLTISFAVVILVGSILLALPISHYPHAPAASYIDHLFTTVSMVCVTGLSVIPVADLYNGFGQVVAMFLMQIGGLGLVTLIAISTFALRRKMDLAGHNLLQSALSRRDSKNLKGYLYFAYRMTFIFEFLAFLIIATDFVPRFGWKHGLFNALFLAISAFCNAGFDNFSTNSLTAFVLNPTINFTLAFLIIAGGLGFAVWIDLLSNVQRYTIEKPRFTGRFYRKLSNESHLVIQTTLFLLAAGTLLTWFLEHNNVKTIGHFTLPQQLMVSFFQSVTMRTAGFATISYTDALSPTNLVYMIQMLIGGAPGGTAGGVKVTTAAIAFLLFKAEVSGQSEVTFEHRIIKSKTIKQTMTVLIFYFSFLILGYLILLTVEPGLEPIPLLFESISAIATVGVSMEVTPFLSIIGKIIIMIFMFVGRVGPITVLISLMQRKEKTVHYASTDILVG
ncbi:TrkH family potassium uptake protein [Streptococcus halichoeri]|uniref:TrkH family potassium uptake protein n=1 Tax=Streptococcus halichoeri TaxID=254785 RepID=UPI0022B0EBF1|nr:potassium transporter TrkG [Streptococcus halichoeri]